MTIVWPCPLSVDAYVAGGRELEFPRPDCPSCSCPMTFWSGYRRPVREAGLCHKIFVPRLRCRALWDHPRPAALFRARRSARCGRDDRHRARRSGRRPGRGAPGGSTRRCPPHDGAGLAAAVLGPGGAHRRLVRGALRRARWRGDRALRRYRPAYAISAIRAAFAAASALPGWASVGLWRFVSSVSGGRLIATNTDSPYLVVGKRRFMPPVPSL